MTNQITIRDLDKLYFTACDIADAGEDATQAWATYREAKELAAVQEKERNARWHLPSFELPRRGMESHLGLEGNRRAMAAVYRLVDAANEKAK